MPMSEPETVLVEHDGPLSWIVLNRPGRLNALSTAMLSELDACLDALAARPQTRVIGIRGAGTSFCSGYDVERDGDEMEHARSTGIVADQQRLKQAVAGFLKIWHHPKPVIAAVHGYCIAGGTQLATLCDITVVAGDARIGIPSIPVGGGYISPMWVPLVGPKRAKQLSFQAGTHIDGLTAAQWGWANYAVDSERLLEEVRNLAVNIARTPADVLSVKKSSINRAADIIGWSTIMPLGAESDALLHKAESVQFINSEIMKHGLKQVIQAFRAGEYQAQVDEFH
jgi:enoyl-CoA hydratase